MQVYVHDLLAARERELLDSLVGGQGGRCWFASPESTESARLAALQESEVALGYCPASWLAQAPALRWMQLLGVGFDAYLPVAATDGFALAVTNMQGQFRANVAETCLGGILALTRGLKPLIEAASSKEWRKDALRPQLTSLANARVLILGNGAIAQCFADLLRPFGARITHYARTASGGNIAGEAALEAALAQTDIVCGFLPDTPATRDLLDARRLALLPPGALVVNAGRGSLLDEQALNTALREGKLRGAVLDVTRQEPLPPDSPLWSCPNLVLTQHTAGGSADELERAIRFFGDNLARYVQGQPLLNVVDWKRGY